MWFVSFSRNKESHWLICHLLCLGNQNLKSLQNNTPKAISLPSLSCCFCLYLFCLVGYCYCGLSLFPTHWGGSLDQKKGHRPLRGTRVPASQVSTHAERMQTHHSLFSVPWILLAAWGGWMQMQWALTVSLNSPWPAGYPGKLWMRAFGFLRARRGQYCVSSHWSTILLHCLLHQRREPSPNSFKPVA